MKEIYFIDLNQNIYDKNHNLIGAMGMGYIVDKTRSNLIFNGQVIGKYINIKNQEDIEKFNKIINKPNNRTLEDIEVSSVKNVIKEENGLLKSYVVTDEGKIYDDNNSFLNFNEKRKLLLLEWLDDPLKSSKIATMSAEELNKELNNSLQGEYKEYSFEDAKEKKDDDKKSKLATERAMDVEGNVNKELGIVKHGVSSEDEYSTVEQRGDEYVVVTPQVVSHNLKSSETSITNSIDNYNQEVQQRDGEQNNYYYMDSEKNVYDAKGEKVPDVNPQYIMIDENNNLWYMDKKVGIYGGTLDDLAQSMHNSEKRANVRTLKKNDSAGFGQIIIITLVLLCLTLFIAVFAVSMFS